MKKIFLFTLAFISVPAIAEEDCACKIYPFEPNPPCYKECVKLLVENKNVRLTEIENLDPSVALSVFALRKQGLESGVDLNSINNQKQLEFEAIKVVPAQGEWRQ